MPYGGAPAAGNNDEVYFLVGDTDTANQYLTDAEVSYLIATYGSGVLAASWAARQLAAKFASRASVTVGDVSEQAGDLSKHFLDLAAMLEQKISAGASPTFGGVDVAKVEQAKNDASQVQPAFDRDQFNNPRASGNIPPFDSGGGL